MVTSETSQCTKYLTGSAITSLTRACKCEEVHFESVDTERVCILPKKNGKHVKAIEFEKNSSFFVQRSDCD